jgi:secreted trypsin-like serine protease
MKTLILSSLLVFCASAAHAGIRDFIFGGSPVDASDAVASTTVLITGHHLGTGILCTGSLIADDTVVTAAHCVVDVNVSTIRVIFTQNVTFSSLMNDPEISDSDPRVHQIYGAIADPSFKSSGDDRHDIAIIRFKGSLNAGYHPAQIVDPSTELSTGEDVIVAGYGSQNPRQESSGGQLRKAQVTIAQLLNSDEMVVNQEKGQGVCWGDSGGPAFIQSGSTLLLWGVTDRAYPNFDPFCNHEAVFTRITSFSGFISQAMATLHEQN